MRIWQAVVIGSVLTGCGGATAPSIPPVPDPTPTPVARPTSTPDPCPHGACGNTNAVTRAQLRIYMMFDENRVPVPVPDPVRQVVLDPIPVGYTFRLDVTGRDANGDETNGRGRIEWFYSGQDLIDTDARSPWQRDIKVVKPGQWSVYVVFDGVSSNALNFTFVPAS